MLMRAILFTLVGLIAILIAIIGFASYRRPQQHRAQSVSPAPRPATTQESFNLIANLSGDPALVRSQIAQLLLKAEKSQPANVSVVSSGSLDGKTVQWTGRVSDFKFVSRWVESIRRLDGVKNAAGYIQGNPASGEFTIQAELKERL